MGNGNSTKPEEVTEPGGDEMNKKAAQKKKEVKPAKPEVKQESKKVEKVEKVVKQPAKKREKKEPLKIKATKGVTVNETKYVLTAEAGEKRMWVRGASVGLTHKVAGLKGFKAVTEEEAKKNHLGKTRMLGKVNSQEELNELVIKYFA